MGTGTPRRIENEVAQAGGLRHILFSSEGRI